MSEMNTGNNGDPAYNSRNHAASQGWRMAEDPYKIPRDSTLRIRDNYEIICSWIDFLQCHSDPNFASEVNGEIQKRCLQHAGPVVTELMHFFHRRIERFMREFVKRQEQSSFRFKDAAVHIRYMHRISKDIQDTKAEFKDKTANELEQAGHLAVLYCYRHALDGRTVHARRLEACTKKKDEASDRLWRCLVQAERTVEQINCLRLVYEKYEEEEEFNLCSWDNHMEKLEIELARIHSMKNYKYIPLAEGEDALSRGGTRGVAALLHGARLDLESLGVEGDVLPEVLRP